MKRPALSLFACLLLVTGAAFSGCGGDEPAPDPNQVIERAFAGPPSAGTAVSGAEVEVVSLGYEDKPLATRTLSIDARTYASLREAISGKDGRGEGGGGLRPLVGDLRSDGTEDLDGVEVEHVSGTLDVRKLIAKVTAATEAGGSLGPGNAELPGLGQLAQLKDMLTEATFDLYAAEDDGSFQRFDLTLSLDDRENALPPTRFRFSLTEPDPEKAPS